jgi:tRNA (cmo5U34)-methyltransferase
MINKRAYDEKGPVTPGPHFNVNPEVYEESVRQTIPFYHEIQSETVDIIRTMKPGVQEWLDTGCGTGYLVEIASRLFPDTTFILTDPDASMLGKAATRLTDALGARVRFLPPIPSESLLSHKNVLKPQVITAILCHHYLDRGQRRMAVGACYSLLEDGGVFVSVENITPGSPAGIELGLERWKRFQIEHGRPAAVAEIHSKRFDTEYFPITIEAHLELLKIAGFQTVELFWSSHMQAGFYAVK